MAAIKFGRKGRIDIVVDALKILGTGIHSDLSSEPHLLNELPVFLH
jgi:hypothetical protein